MLCLFEPLLVTLLQLQFLVLVLAQLSSHLDQVFLQFLDGFLEHWYLFLLHGLVLCDLFVEAQVLLLIGGGLFCF